jgi:hypothetical protein
VIVLRSEGVLARLDPAHGGEILEFVDVTSGRQLLAHPPFASLAPRGGSLDEDTWTDQYRGGWQTVTPNAGNACTVDGEEHGFHGRASNDPWQVLDVDSASAALRWSGHGLEVNRRVSAAGDALSVETHWRALRDGAALVAVEHLVVGTELFAPTGTLRLPGGKAFELSETTGPTSAPPGAPRWPEVVLQDGAVERSDRLSTDSVDGRFLAVEQLPEGWYEVVNEHTGQGLRVEWDVVSLPNLWIWREIRATGGRWRSQAEMVGLEPASVPHSLGLARAVREGQAIVLQKWEDFQTTIMAGPFRAS